MQTENRGAFALAFFFWLALAFYSGWVFGGSKPLF
jgi:hypothetical protein